MTLYGDKSYVKLVIVEDFTYNESHFAVKKKKKIAPPRNKNKKKKNSSSLVVLLLLNLALLYADPHLKIRQLQSPRWPK
jgi:hypothetical protein